MAEEIKALIEKINQEGIRVAQEKAQEIEAQARGKAEEIIAKAQRQAETLLLQAKENIAGMEAKQRAHLAQAGRDLLLSVRKEITAMLEKLMAQQVRQALGPQELYQLILELTKHYGRGKEEIVITLKKEDLQALEKGFLHKLKEETKKGITLKPAQEIHAGFTISFDAGKSCFDFSDQALAEYIGGYLKPKLEQILKEAVS